MDTKSITKRKTFMTCAYCGKDASLLCGKCRIVKYCNRDCQKEDWSIHKELCKYQIKGSDAFKLSIKNANHISSCIGFQVFVGSICHYVKLKREEVLTCAVIKMKDYYQISAHVIDKYQHRSYHLAHHTITFLICNEGEKIDFETHKTFNAITLSPEKCKQNYMEFIIDHKFESRMKRDGWFGIKLLIDGDVNYISDFNWEDN